MHTITYTKLPATFLREEQEDCAPMLPPLGRSSSVGSAKCRRMLIWSAPKFPAPPLLCLARQNDDKATWAAGRSQHFLFFFFFSVVSHRQGSMCTRSGRKKVAGPAPRDPPPLTVASRRAARPRVGQVCSFSAIGLACGFLGRPTDAQYR